MTHALADVVLVEHFYLACGVTSEKKFLCCPGCLRALDIDETPTLGQLLTAARRHILEDHPGGDPLSHEHAYTVALHAVDASQGDPYPALIPEAYMPVERPGKLSDVNRCQACGRTVRGPLLPLWRPDEPVVMAGPGCFRAHRQNVSHVADPLPMPPAEEGANHG
jgi:hypothetical protein